MARAAERFDYLYNSQELQEWSERIRALTELAETVHVLFNNNIHDYALQNGRELRALLRASLPGVEVVTAAED